MDDQGTPACQALEAQPSGGDQSNLDKDQVMQELDAVLASDSDEDALGASPTGATQLEPRADELSALGSAASPARPSNAVRKPGHSTAPQGSETGIASGTTARRRVGAAPTTSAASTTDSGSGVAHGIAAALGGWSFGGLLDRRAGQGEAKPSGGGDDGGSSVGGASRGLGGFGAFFRGGDADRDSVGGSVVSGQQPARSRAGTFDDGVSVAASALLQASPRLQAAKEAMRLPEDAAALLAFAGRAAAGQRGKSAGAEAGAGVLSPAMPSFPPLPRAIALRRLAAHFGRSTWRAPAASGGGAGAGHSGRAAADSGGAGALDDVELKECLGSGGLVQPAEVGCTVGLADPAPLAETEDKAEWASAAGAAMGGKAGLQLLLHLAAGGALASAQLDPWSGVVGTATDGCAAVEAQEASWVDEAIEVAGKLGVQDGDGEGGTSTSGSSSHEGQGAGLTQDSSTSTRRELQRLLSADPSADEGEGGPVARAVQRACRRGTFESSAAGAIGGVALALGRLAGATDGGTEGEGWLEPAWRAVEQLVVPAVFPGAGSDRLAQAKVQLEAARSRSGGAATTGVPAV